MKKAELREIIREEILKLGEMIMKKSELQQIIIEEYNKLNEGSRLDKEAKKLKSGDWFIIHASDSKGEALNRPLQFIKYNRFAQWILCVDENGKQLRANTAQDPQLEERYIEKIKKVSKLREVIKEEYNKLNEANFKYEVVLTKNITWKDQLGKQHKELKGKVIKDTNILDIKKLNFPIMIASVGKNATAWAEETDVKIQPKK